jgi:ACS family hexuronate transporter-like MFS transporter
MFPKRAVGSVVGLGGMAGATGGLLLSPLIGYILQHTHNNYLIPFLISGSAYLVAFVIIQALAPRLEPAALDGPGVRG